MLRPKTCGFMAHPAVSKEERCSVAHITMLTPAQVAEREQRKGPGRMGRRRSPERTRIIEEYKVALQEAHPGYGADVFLVEGEDKGTVRHNLQAAGEELGHVLDFRPIRDPSRLHFRVITPEERAAKPKRGGRPRKPAAAVQVAEGEPGGHVQEPPPAQPGMIQDAPVEPPKKRGRRPRTAANHEAAA